MKNDISIYIHIPFCVRKCLYCDFPSEAFDPGKEEEYLRSILFEIEAAYKELEGRSVKTVYFGGGTPSVIPAGHIVRILEALKKNLEFDPDAEISMEMNPGTVDEESIEQYLAAGINRFSLGMQSAIDSELKALGRIHDNRDLSEAFRLLRKHGVNNINLDIMTGIPHQDRSSIKKTLETVITLNPEHVSAYALIIESGTPFCRTGREKLGLPDEDDEMWLYEYALGCLKESGFERYEISNYARPEKECRHNITYWECLDYMGFGCAAASRMGKRRFSNTRDLDSYIRQPLKNRTEDLILSDEELMSEFIFMGMRMIKGISISRFHERFDKSIFDVYGKALKKHTDSGLILKEGDRLRLSARGIDVSNMIFADFV